MSTHFEPGTRDWLAQMQRFIQPLKDRVMSIAARGWVRLVYRCEPMQLLQVEVLKDELKDVTEHFQPYGFTSAPLENMDALVHFLSGDRSHGIVSVVADRTHRPLTLEEGDVSLYHKSDSVTASAEEARHRITLTLGKLIIRVRRLRGGAAFRRMARGYLRMASCLSREPAARAGGARGRPPRDPA